MKKILLLLFYCISIFADGTLDLSLNGSGKIESTFGVDSTAKAVAIQVDGKIVVAGYTDMTGRNTFALARYHEDGSLDQNFGDNGLVVTEFGAGETISGARALVIQPDGRIVAGGFTNAIKNKFRWCLARYNVDGSLDETFFGGRGIILGTAINTFDSNDEASQLNALALQPDGKIVAAGYSVMNTGVVCAVARYNSNGTLDTSFNAKGIGSIAGTVRTDFGSMSIKDDQANAVVIARDGKIIIGGSSYVTGVKTFAMARYLPNGNLDTSFFSPGYSRVHGTVVTSFAGGETDAAINALLIQPDDKIVAAGYTNSCIGCNASRFALARYFKSGMLDTSFGGDGTAMVPGTVVTNFGAQENASKAYALLLQGDGKLVVGGTIQIGQQTYFALSRYKERGCLDYSFNGPDSAAGTIMSRFCTNSADSIFRLALHANGAITAVGKMASNLRPQCGISRYLTSNVPLMMPTINYPTDGQRIVNGSAIKINGIAQNPGIVHLYLNDAYLGYAMTEANSNTWSYTLPPLASGDYAVRAMQVYPAGRVNLMASQKNFIVDQHPCAQYDDTFSVVGMNQISGKLKAVGASGNYDYKIQWVSNGDVVLDDDTFTFVPNIACGIGTIAFEAIDKETGCSNSAHIVITIHPMPSATDKSFEMLQDGILNESLVDAISNGLPPYELTAVESDGNGMVVINPDGSFTFNPNPGFYGIAHFKYKATDQRGGTSELATASVVVHQLPNAYDSTLAMCQDTELTGTVSDLIKNGLAPYECEVVDTLTRNGKISLCGDGSFSFKPDNGYVGLAQFGFKVSDARHGKSNVAIVSIDVQEAPHVENVSFDVVRNTIINNTVESSVLKGTAPYRFRLVGTPENGCVQMQEDGLFTFIPSENFIGVASFNYVMVDARQYESNQGTASITLYPQSHAMSVVKVVMQNLSVSGDLARFVNLNKAPSQFKHIGQASHGTVSINADGTYTFIPDAGFVGQASFQYTFIDEHQLESSVGRVTINVLEQPKAADAITRICKNEICCAHLLNLVSGGTPPYSFAQIGNADNGSVTIDPNGTYTFVPNAGFCGDAHFNYIVTDSCKSISNVATMTLKVASRPMVMDESKIISQNNMVEGNLQSLIRHGTPAYQFKQVDQAVGGTAVVNEDGTYRFTPYHDFSGDAYFTYVVTDANTHVSNRGKVSINVQKPPQVTKTTFGIQQDKSLHVNLADYVSNGIAPLTFTADQAVNGTVTMNADGSFDFIPNAEFYGDASFQCQVIDAIKGMSKTTILIAVHQKPRAVDESKIVYRNMLLTGNLTEHIVAGKPPYKFALVDSAFKGAVAVNTIGVFTIKPKYNFIGSGYFKYIVTDANNCISDICTMSINVLEPIRAKDNIFSDIHCAIDQDGVLQADLSNKKENQ